MFSVLPKAISFCVCRFFAACFFPAVCPIPLMIASCDAVLGSRPFSVPSHNCPPPTCMLSTPLAQIMLGCPALYTSAPRSRRTRSLIPTTFARVWIARRLLAPAPAAASLLVDQRGYLRRPALVAPH
eukprot:352338-Chlamydomonas_euryale.AAC.8